MRLFTRPNPGQSSDRAVPDVVTRSLVSGEEIEEEVLEGPQSIVWDQAEARLHTAKAVLLWALGMDG